MKTRRVDLALHIFNYLCTVFFNDFYWMLSWWVKVVSFFDSLFIQLHVKFNKQSREVWTICWCIRVDFVIDIWDPSSTWYPEFVYWMCTSSCYYSKTILIDRKYLFRSAIAMRFYFYPKKRHWMMDIIEWDSKKSIEFFLNWSNWLQ